MAQFKISLPNDFREKLAQDCVYVENLRHKEEVPPYNIFVNNLMKSMNSPAEELHHAATGMSGEAGEILDVSKKVWVYNKQLDIEHLLEEMGDLRFYYQAMLNMLGLNDEHIKAQNVLKLQKRYTAGVYSDKEAQERKDKQPLSAEGTKGDGAPRQRSFIGAKSEETSGS